MMIHSILKGRQLVLASESPRRKIIFDMLNLTAVQMPPMITETKERRHPRDRARQNAHDKVKDVMKKVDWDCVVVGADTVVCIDDQIFEKPTTKKEAHDMLRSLSGNTHIVYTAVTVGYQRNVVTKFGRTYVTFKELSDEEINEYIRSGEPMDKAGAYGIQGLGSQFIHSIKGGFYNVMGLPLGPFKDALEEIFCE